MSFGRALLLLQRLGAPMTPPARPERAGACPRVPESGDKPAAALDANAWGIRDADYRLWRAGRSLVYASLAYISREEALECIHDLNWLPAQCHRLAWPLAVATLACALHTGVPSAQRMLRRALLVTVMGPHLGAQAAAEAQAQQPGRFEWPLTEAELAAIDAQPVLPLLAAVLDARRAWLTEIAERDASTQAALLGWFASINALELALGNGVGLSSLPRSDACPRTPESGACPRTPESGDEPALMAALPAT